MSSEITITAVLAFSKGGASASAQKVASKVDMSGSDYIEGTKAIGTSEEAIGLGDIGTPGYAYFENLDATDSIEIRGASGGADLVKLGPGQAAVLPLAADATPYAIASANTPLLRYLILEA